MQKLVGSLAVDVTVPQVTGGDPKVAEVFNSAMRASLDDRIAESDTGTLTGSDGEVAHIGARVISGVLLLTAEGDQDAVDLVDTVVVNLDNGKLITLDDLFPDLDAGLERLRAKSAELGPSTSAGGSFDTAKVTAERETFSRWVATPEGMRIYFAEGTVAPRPDGVVELTVPWDELSDLVPQGVTRVVGS
ncbi:RsiV family protein [Rhodococcus koreensis]